MHAKRVIDMLDTALNMLGPDYELLTEIMLEMGAKHERYGVTADMYPLMQRALLSVLEEILGPEEFKPKAREAWIFVFEKLAGDMIRGGGLAWRWR